MHSSVSEDRDTFGCEIGSPMNALFMQNWDILVH